MNPPSLRRSTMLSFCGVISISMFSVGTAKIPVIIDTDLGQDIDDTWSIGFLLSSPELDVKLITTSSRCTKGKADLLAKFLSDIGRSDVAIGVGISTSPRFLHGGDRWCNGTGLEDRCTNGFFVGPAAPYSGNFGVENYTGSKYDDAVRAIAEVLAKNAFTKLIAIGPFTNLAALQARFPAVLKRAHVIAMGGSIRKGWNARGSPTAEYNVATDAVASRNIFRKTHLWGSFAIAPLDTCGDLQIVGSSFQELLDTSHKERNPLLKHVLEMYTVWFDHGCSHGSWCSPACTAYSPVSASTTLFDVQPAYMAASLQTWDVDFIVEKLRLDVNASGFTIESPYGGIVNVTTAWRADGRKRFLETVLNHYLMNRSKENPPQEMDFLV
eukprot:TRINITY_DN10688_c0_g2_i1.p1 TRINITY_DN10688_c0_g2~~TRINITY_DN10688_c0_g2_i1.p1  ORF type:complete len:383 (-),score=53.53 TRINITY_DN10688_c0_g2_i1:744-1892(-)